MIVSDNDDEPSAQALAQSSGEAFGLELIYVHAPARNISVARNACLDSVDAPLIAFLDDDETAQPQWLARLIEHLWSSGSDVVFGPVIALYAPDAPAWARAADLHSIRPVTRRGVIATGYTSNVLMRRSACGSRRFDLRFGRSGGEDTLFFHQLGQAGAVLSYCDGAAVNEAVPPTRVRTSWLLRRFYRAGQTHAYLLRTQATAGTAAVAQAAAKSALCLAAAALNVGSPAGWRRWLVRGALHLGVATKLLGGRDLVLYGDPERA